MLAFGRNILLWLSFSLLLMHSLVPHHHSDHHDCQETHVSETPKPDNPFAYFLQAQLGEGHLEHFLSEDQAPSSSSLQFIAPEVHLSLDFAGYHIIEKCTFTLHNNSFFLSPLDYQKPLRAPPVV